jgi:protein Tex
MKPIGLRIAEELGVGEQQVAAAISLLDGGATVPFVARYRKEATGGSSPASSTRSSRAYPTRRK